jgi:uncharacterized protein (DUF433 family)
MSKCAAPAAIQTPGCDIVDVGFGVLRHSEMHSVIVKDPNILGGEPVFRGTRVPFKILIEYLEGGDTLDQFLEQYPSVSRELAIAAIEEARSSLVSRL